MRAKNLGAANEPENPAKLEWSELQLMLALARGTGLARAAELLGVDPSTVHRRIGALEQRFGHALFERHRRGGWLATAMGERLLASATRMEEEVASAERALASADARLEGSVRLTTTDTLAQMLLMPMLAALHEQHPNLSIELSVANRLFVFGRGEAELALRGGARPSERSVVARKLAELGGAIYASRAYLERHGRPRRRSELSEHHFVLGDSSLAHVSYTQRAEALRGSSPPALRCGSLLAQKAAVEAGLGVAVLPCFLGDRSPELIRLFAPDSELVEPLWLVVHEELRRVARVRVVADHLTKAITAIASELAGRG
jgi:DNA-binding transcriptional LysR family regulator